MPARLGCRLHVSVVEGVLMPRFVLSAVILALAACASPQRLSASIYMHEQQASELDHRGEHQAAAAERRAAAHERERLGAIRPVVLARESW
ncbi:MAG: hypothetical protein ACXVDD_26600 [Polyangia bacterium]